MNYSGGAVSDARPMVFVFSHSTKDDMTKKQTSTFLLAIGFLLTLFSLNLSAGIISVTGDIQIISPPASVVADALQSDTTGVIFQERSEYVLLADTRVSIPGTIGTYDEQSDMRPTDILAGTTVNSYLLHFDPVSSVQNYQGTVEFAEPIIGVMLLPFALDNSDMELGATVTTYPSMNPSSRRGLDFADQVDTFIISDSRTIAFNLESSNLIDQIRVVTSPTSVPEPGSAGLLCLAAAVFGWRTFKRRAAR